MKELILAEKKANDLKSAKSLRMKQKKVNAKIACGIVPAVPNKTKKAKNKNIAIPSMPGSCDKLTGKNFLALEEIKPEAPLFIVVIKGNKSLAQAQKGGGGGKYDMPCESVFKNIADMHACSDSKKRKIHAKSVKSHYSKAGKKAVSLKKLSVKLNLTSEEIKKEILKSAKYMGTKGIKKAINKLPLNDMFMGTV